LATVTVGSETQGSIVSPSMVNSVVGLKPSRGLVSSDYVIPLVDWMDTAGPIGRTVTDVAILLSAMVGVDEGVETGDALAEMQVEDFARFATQEAARELVIAIPVYDEAFLEDEIAMLADLGVELDEAQRATFSDELDGNNQRLEALRQVIEGAGMDTVSVSATGFPGGAPVFDILEFGFQDSFNRFAMQAGGAFPVDQLADVVAFNEAEPSNRAPYGQSYVAGSVNTQISPDEYAAIKEQAGSSAAQALDAMLDAGGADILLINDLSTTLTQAYASAGYPAITLPLGYAADGKPVGILLTGKHLSEPELIAAAYAIEQSTQARRAPDLDGVLESFRGLNLAEPVIE
jgi:amidase